MQLFFFLQKMRLREEGLYQQTVYVENQHGFLSQTLYLVSTLPPLKKKGKKEKKDVGA
jgi:hypothetical protein